MHATNVRSTAAVVLVALASLSVIDARQSPGAGQSPLTRRYRDGESLHYTMRGDNSGRTYRAQASGVVKRDAAGHFVEEYTWSDLVSNGVPVALPAPDRAMRQQVSLDPDYKPSMPNLASIDPRLLGPVLDFMNFYVDLLLAIRQPDLRRQGSHVVVPRAAANSWADGKGVIIGEDAIDFDITLTAIDQGSRAAIVTVRHVPPARVHVQLPAEWMRAPVADTPNNWVQVAKKEGGGYVASVGKETFDVRLEVSLDDGRIVSATMNNPVQIVERECSDAALLECRAPRRYEIHRQIDLR